MKYFIFIALIISITVNAEMNNFTYTYDANNKDKLDFIERVNLANFPNLVRKEINSGKIRVYKSNSAPHIKFVVSSIHPGDKILLNKQEVIKAFPIFIKNGALKKFGFFIYGLFEDKQPKQFYPFVGIRKSDNSKYYGLLKIEDFVKLTPNSTVFPLNKKELINYKVSNKLTIIYSFCPHDRKDQCEFSIKHHGKWITNSDGNIKKFYGMALSKKCLLSEHKSVRIIEDCDTPQGIYGIWASMFSKQPDFGCVPRIDIDLNTIPINGYPYNIFSDLLEELVPSSALEEYWLNELPLAYAMGRSLFRIHANPVDCEISCNYQPNINANKYYPRHGCIIMDKNQMTEFFSTLAKLKIFSKDDSLLNCENYHSDNVVQWHPSKQIGKVFLIVKDLD